MKLRWSNGHNRAHEFDGGSRADFERTLEDAMIEYRRVDGSAATERLELHVEDSPGVWVDPVFPPAADAEPIRFPADFCNGRATDGHAEFRLARRTHVIQSAAPVCAGSRTRGDWQIVLGDGYSPRAEPTLCGLYWADWVLKVGPGRWHADVVYAACVAAIRAANEFSGFIADVGEAVGDVAREHSTREVPPLQP
ncbi:MAG TPA: hypothetical protein VMY35_06450 [Phycisphaerae bacterium]|nr:hypothetical protein [Phycisphaerae bacterium]